MMFQPYCFYGFFGVFFVDNSVLSQLTLDLKQMLINNTNSHQNVNGVQDQKDGFTMKSFLKVHF